MSKQLDLLGSQIIPTALHTEMERSYLEYAMSVIVGRALPDIKDGLKPVHRRILYAMYELGLVPDRPYRKCARVVGDVLGKYHPHGDQAVYDALVRMVQPFSSRYPLLAGHGNFGSIDNDPPAAMRYTETKLAPIAFEAMLDQIGDATVDWTDNFDNSQIEPVVLPVQLPILLLNGCSGIAVGMATNIPPHNLGEVVDGLIALIDKPDLSDEKLWQIIPGPDFPTGGEIVETGGIHDTYRVGRGSIKVRGVAKVEVITSGNKRKTTKSAIVVTQLPFQVNKAAWIEKIADLVNQGKLDQIADIRDESDRDGMRVVIELKRDAQPPSVLKQLYKYTALSNNFGAIMLALLDNQPVQFSLRQMLSEFLAFREATLRRQYQHQLDDLTQRQHILAGLLSALQDLDTVVEILRNAPDGTTAKAQFAEQLELTAPQSDAILAMPMRRLTGQDRQKLEQEYQENQQQIQQLEKLLGDRHELLKSLKRELRSLKRRFGDPRRTKIITATESTSKIKSEPAKTKSKAKVDKATIPQLALDLEPQAGDKIKITADGEIYWQSSKHPQPDSSSPTVAEYPIGSQQLIVVLDSGKAYPLSIEQIPAVNHKPRVTILSLLSKAAQRDAERVVTTLMLGEEIAERELVLLTASGKIKRLAMAELQDIGNRGLSLIKLKDGDRLEFVSVVEGQTETAIATNSGRILRLAIDEGQIPLMGRTAQGQNSIPLRYGESLAGCVAIAPKDQLVLVTSLGYVKKIPANLLRLGKTGDIGTSAIQFTSKQDRLIALLPAPSKAKLILLSSQAQVWQEKVEQLKLWGKDGKGDRTLKLNSSETIRVASII